MLSSLRVGAVAARSTTRVATGLFASASSTVASSSRQFLLPQHFAQQQQQSHQQQWRPFSVTSRVVTEKMVRARPQQTPVILPTIDTPVRVLHPPVQNVNKFVAKAAEDRQHLNYADKFAIVDINGRQHKVCADDLVMTDKLAVDVGQNIVLDRVLMIGGIHDTVIGRPIIEGATVTATIEEQAQTAKVRVFKKKRRKGYKRTKGFRALVTVMRIGEIIPGPTLAAK